MTTLAPCIHHWLLPDPAPGVRWVSGTCKKCGEQRERAFDSYQGDSDTRWSDERQEAFREAARKGGRVYAEMRRKA